jgi:hypothetical protein
MAERARETTQFDYLLNAFEQASQSDSPADHDYAGKRRALFAYVRDLEARAAKMENALRWVDGEIGDWPGERPEGRGPYFWRREMMQRAGLAHLTPEAPHAD